MRIQQQPVTDGVRQAIPRTPRRLVTDDEIDGVFAEAKARLRRGREKYGGSWTEADLKADLIEECHDLMNYAAMMILRVREAFPDYDGLTSNELVPELLIERGEIDHLRPTPGVPYSSSLR